jgi:MFS family permease
MKSAALAPQSESAVLGGAIIPLLALAIFINYVDRGNLATAAPLIADQLHLSNAQIGLLLSAFFWSYVPAQILAGWLAQHINPYRTLGIGLALWSISTAVSGLASGFYSLIGLRVLLGLGESAAYPCSSNLLACHLALNRLGSANGVIMTGQALGPAFGTFVGGLLISQIGWRSVYIIFGLASMLWLVPWCALTRHVMAHTDAKSAETGPSFVEILRRREIWGASFGQFCTGYAFYFLISWLPLYLVKARGLSVIQMAELGGLIYVVYAASSYSIGWLSDRWVRSGVGLNRARKTVIISGHLVMAASLATTAVGDLRVSVVSLFCAGLAFGTLPSQFAIGQTLAGSRAAGKWIGIQNSIGNCAGIIAPIITGFVVDRTGQYYWAFVVAASIAATGIIGWGLVIKKVEPLAWGAAGGASGAMARSPT